MLASLALQLAVADDGIIVHGGLSCHQLAILPPPSARRKAVNGDGDTDDGKPAAHCLAHQPHQYD